LHDLFIQSSATACHGRVQAREVRVLDRHQQFPGKLIHPLADINRSARS
jgi:hypothetical protein